MDFLNLNNMFTNNMSTGVIVFILAVIFAVMFVVIAIISFVVNKGKEFAQSLADRAQQEAQLLINQQLFEEREQAELLLQRNLHKSLKKMSKHIANEDLAKKLGIDDSLGIDPETVEGVERYHRELASDVRYNLLLEESMQTVDILKNTAQEATGWEGSILKNIANRQGKNFTMKVKNGELSTQERKNGYINQQEYQEILRQVFNNEQIGDLESSGEVTKTHNIGTATIFITARKKDILSPATIIFGWIPKHVYIERSTGKIVATEELDETFSQFNTDFNEFAVDFSEFAVDFNEFDETKNVRS